jgi:sugar/nucleoside kinase (ribokinase family)
MNSQFGLLAIGNAIVDILAPASEEFVASQSVHGMKKGVMNLIDATRAESLYKLLKNPVETSGGSAGNTMACYASLGGRGAYIGKVAEDRFGQVFAHDLQEIGVRFSSRPLTDDLPTAQCLILVTPEGQRTMNTFLGACTKLGPADIDPNLIVNSDIIFLEGYLFDPPEAKSAFYKAAQLARAAKKRLALTLSDTFCVDRHRADFLDLIKNHVNILFANEQEILSLYQTKNLDQAIQKVRGYCELCIVTRSEKGSLIIDQFNTIEVPAVKPARLLDSTGAGDAYAAGFLYGLTYGKTLEECGFIGSASAAEIIAHMGPRPTRNLAELLRAA